MTTSGRCISRATLSSVAFLSVVGGGAWGQARGVVPAGITEHAPPVRHYLAYRASTPLTIDGVLDDAAWAAAPWTTDFVDIEGARGAAPRFRTRAKLLWDDRFLYVAAELDEPDVWGTLTARDAVIYHDNDFEMFFDADGDTHDYGELEINALNTVWDLRLAKPYRDGGPAINAWDIAGLKSQVHVNGTLNHPGDRDRGWTVELALPWASLAATPGAGRAPVDGDQWRVNFSRVEWHATPAGGVYRKDQDAAGHDLPEDNWVWSPQDAINMHMPEMWGIVQFSTQPAGGAPATFHPDPDDEARWTLRRVYYAERAYHDSHGSYAGRLSDLTLTGVERVALRIAPDGYEATIPGARPGTTWHIRQDGKVWP